MDESKTILYLGIDPSRFEQKNACFHLPLIEIIGRDLDLDPFVKQATHILFTSRSAVRLFFKLLAEQKFSLCHKEVIAVGPATALLLEEKGQRPLVAKECTAEGVVALLKELDLSQGHLFFPHSALSRPIISTYLEKEKISHSKGVLYDTVFKKPATLPDLDQFEEIVFTSPSTVEAFLHFFGRFPQDKKLTAIGPVTRQKIISKKRTLF